MEPTLALEVFVSLAFSEAMLPEHGLRPEHEREKQRTALDEFVLKGWVFTKWLNSQIKKPTDGPTK